MTPTSGVDAEPYRLLSGTIKAVYNAHRGIGVVVAREAVDEAASVDDELIVSPGMLGGGTGTHFVLPHGDFG